MTAMFYVESQDGSMTYAGPYSEWWEANDAAEALEAQLLSELEVVERDR